MEVARRALLRGVDQENIRRSKKVTILHRNILKKCFELFAQHHFWVKPVSKDELGRLCAEKNINMGKIHRNANGMLTNACLSPKCQHFLVPMTRVEMRAHMALWCRRKPNRFHADTIAHLKSGVSPKQITADYFRNGKVSAKYGKDEQFVEEYIASIAEVVLHK